MDKPENSNSDLLLLSMDPTEGGQHDTPISSSYGIHDNGILLSTPLTESHYNIGSSRNQCDILRNGSSSDYLMKDPFIDGVSNDIPLDVDIENRYRQARQINSNFMKIGQSTYENDIQDMPFSNDIRSLNREIRSDSSYNYYQKVVSPAPDIYGQNFNNEFPSSNFTNSLPSTSGIFAQDNTMPNYTLSENHTDELLLSSIELNENEKLILSNEEMAILTQGKPGSCLELILNNGEVLYAVIDSENDFDYSSSRLMQMSKEILNPVRHCSVTSEMEDNIVNQLPETNFNDGMSDSSNFSTKSSPVRDFNVCTTDYLPTASTSLSKTINSSITNESFNLCCDFTGSAVNQFSSNVNSYSPMVSTKPSTYSESLLGKSDVNYSCTSTSLSSRSIPAAQSNSELLPNAPVEPATSKTDYFPSAVNSIVVSETGKKYPKKYSFYSDFSSFLNQETSFNKDCRSSNSESSKLCDLPCSTTASRDIQQPLMQMNQQISTNIESNNSSVPVETTANSHLPADMPVQTISPTINGPQVRQDTSAPLQKQSITLSDGAEETFYPMNLEKEECTLDINRKTTEKDPLKQDETGKDKFLNSESVTKVYTIYDRAVQSRARATLPSEYLSISRIRLSLNNKKTVYGVFARKTIPSRTQFGPVEGLLIKNEADCDDSNVSEDNVLQLTIKFEDGKLWRLDTSNEDACNWMRYVRPATSYKEQNLILSQQGTSLYFTTIEVIHPKQELLVWYSARYSFLRNYKLLPGDPCTDLPFEIIQQADELSVVSKLKKENSENSGTQNLVPESDISFVDDSKDTNDILEIIPKQDNSFTKSEFTETPPLNKKQRFLKKAEKSDKSLWLCTYCDLTFQNSAVMNLHALTHVSNDDSEKEDGNLVKDNINFQLDNYSCPQCNQKFLIKNELVAHVSKHGLKVQRWNDNKSAEFSSADAQQDEEDNREEKNLINKYQCQFCKKTFKNPTALSIHERVHSSNLLLECPICDATFQKLMAMKEHVHTHAKDGIFSCPHCSKTFEGYKFIRKHIRSCHVTAKYICKQCKKSFRSQHKLRSHMLKHSDKREFLCANCGKQFKRRDKLTEHIKNIHSEEREKKSLEIMKSAMEAKSTPKKTLKKLPPKVLRLITENVNDYFYKCYICNIGFKRRGMLVNHLNSLHPAVSLDTIPELNVPILKAYCNFFCLYCDRVYKSSSKRKAHIIKSHPGAKIPENSEKGMVLNDPYAKHVGSVITNPFNCEFCYRQYASRGKLLNHHRKEHSNLLPPEIKFPRHKNSQKKKKKLESKSENNILNILKVINSSDIPENANDTLPLQNPQFQAENNVNINMNNTQAPLISLHNSSKDNISDANQTISLQQLLNEDLRNSVSQEQYLKIVQSLNGITIAQTDENSSTLLQQILNSYSFPNS